MGHYDDLYEFYKDRPCPPYETGRADREQYLVHKKIKKKSQTREEWLKKCNTEELAEALGHLVFEQVGIFIRQRTADNSMFTKEYWMKWLKGKYSQDDESKQKE